jgi:hypothetical protein
VNEACIVDLLDKKVRDVGARNEGTYRRVFDRPSSATADQTDNLSVLVGRSAIAKKWSSAPRER